MEKHPKSIAGNVFCRIFAVSEMTNPVLSAWGKPTPTLPKINKSCRLATLVYLK